MLKLCICGHQYHEGVAGKCLTPECPCFKLRYVEVKPGRPSTDLFQSAGNYPSVEWPRWRRVMDMEFDSMPLEARPIFGILSYPMRSELVQ